MTQNLQQDIEEMHNVFGHPVSYEPHMLESARGDFRLKLIRSEVNELEEAMWNNDLVEMLDAIVDIMVVTVGTAVEAGLPVQAAWDIVLASNFSKLGEDGKAILSRGEELDGEPEGKFLKGPNYWKPTEKLKALIASEIEVAEKVKAIHESHQVLSANSREIDRSKLRMVCYRCQRCTCHSLDAMLAPCDPTNYQAS